MSGGRAPKRTGSAGAREVTALARSAGREARGVVGPGDEPLPAGVYPATVLAVSQQSRLSLRPRSRATWDGAVRTRLTWTFRISSGPCAGRTLKGVTSLRKWLAVAGEGAAPEVHPDALLGLPVSIVVQHVDRATGQRERVVDLLPAGTA